MNEQNNEKYSSRISQTIGKWGSLLLSIFSYSLILGFAVIGVGLMAFSTIFALLFDSGLFSGFGLLTGDVIFTAGGSLLLWKLCRELDVFNQSLKKTVAGSKS